jgi:hypothetical protein
MPLYFFFVFIHLATAFFATEIARIKPRDDSNYTITAPATVGWRSITVIGTSTSCTENSRCLNRF